MAEDMKALDAAEERAMRINAADDMLVALQAVLADCRDVDTDSCISKRAGALVVASVEKATGRAA